MAERQEEEGNDGLSRQEYNIYIYVKQRGMRLIEHNGGHQLMSFWTWLRRRQPMDTMKSTPT